MNGEVYVRGPLCCLKTIRLQDGGMMGGRYDPDGQPCARICGPWGSRPMCEHAMVREVSV